MTFGRAGETRRGGVPMRRSVGVGKDLSPVCRALRRRGFSVVVVDEDGEARTEAVDALVVSGQRRDMLGIPAPTSAVPVIDADGRTPDEVVRAIESALRRGRQD